LSEVRESLGLYLDQIDAGPLLDHGEEVEFARPLHGGCSRSRRRLIEKNLRLVIGAAKKYRGLGIGSRPGLSFLYLRDVVDPPGNGPRRCR
jgi:DNA-directed RNA polymerase sigma subunit (sigma70/sigma32)